MSLRARIEAVVRELHRRSEFECGRAEVHADSEPRAIYWHHASRGKALHEAADLIAAALKEEEGGDGNT